MRHALFLVLLLMLSAPGLARAQDGAGTSSATVLRLEPTPRAFALGDAYATLAGDAMSSFYNPARLDPRQAGLAFAFQSLPLDAGAGTAAGSTRLGPGVIGAGAVFLNYGSVDVIEPDPDTNDEWGVPTGERAGGGEIALGTGYAMTIGGGVRLGVGVKLLRVEIAEITGNGAAFDLGASLETLSGRLIVSLAAQNMGREMGAGRSAPLPTTTRLGTALRLGAEHGNRLAIGLDAARQSGEMALTGGIETAYVGTGDVHLIGRLGYRLQQNRAQAPDSARRPLTVGAGIRRGRFTVDYAHRPLGPLGTTHLVGLTIHTTH